ncbi:MAG: putative signal transducing protein [bacterium]
MFDFFRSKKSAVYGDWPLKEDGSLVEPAFLVRIGDKAGEQHIVRGMLEAFGIPNVVRYPQDGDFGSVIMGSAPFGVEIYVPETLIEDARNILNSENFLENQEE